MKSAELTVDLASKFDNFPDALLCDAGSIHPGIYIHKNPDVRTPPRSRLLGRLDEDRYAGTRKIFRNFERALRIGADHGIGKEDISSADLARGQEFQRRGTLEIDNSMLDQPAQDGAEFCGFDVRTPTIRIIAEHLQCSLDVDIYQLRVNDQRGSDYAIDIVDLIGLESKIHLSLWLS